MSVRIATIIEIAYPFDLGVSGVVSAVAGPYCIDAAEVYLAGAFAGQGYLAGASEGMIFIPGAKAQEVDCGR